MIIHVGVSLLKQKVCLKAMPFQSQIPGWARREEQLSRIIFGSWNVRRLNWASECSIASIFQVLERHSLHFKQKKKKQKNNKLTEKYL